MKLADYHIAIGNATDTGKVREQNEDYMAHFDTPFGYCIIICDGMGGHAGGQVAAQNAIVSIQQYLQDPQNKTTDCSLALKNSIEFANFQLREIIIQMPELQGMGTTCVLALIKKGYLYTAHAGDSRIYLIRKKVGTQITKDHSSVQQLIDNGLLSEEEAELSDKKNQIVKAIGVFEKVQPTVSESPTALHKNDRLLLCSDGLTAHVSKEQLLKTVLKEDNVQNASLKLIELANEGGGSDNVTVQLVHYSGKTVRNKKRKFIRKRAVAALLFTGLSAIIFLGYTKYKDTIWKSQNTDSTDSKILKETFKKTNTDTLKEGKQKRRK